MPEMMQRIIRAFGANRIELTTVNETFVEFTITGWSDFIIESHSVGEWRPNPNRYDHDTANAKWLTAIAQGKKRDDEGNLK